MLIAVLGLPGSGKTFFAKQLAMAVNGKHLSSDVLRKEIQSNPQYSQQGKLAVYDKMLQQVNDHAIQQTLVLDATFYLESIRVKFEEKAKLLGVPLYWIEVVASESVVNERLKFPRPDSDADFGVFLKIRNEFEPVNSAYLTLHSDRDTVEEMIKKALFYIHYPHGSA